MQFPEKGYYYHYKHDPKLDVFNYSYEVIGSAIHSEDEYHVVVYRPLYESDYSRHVDYCIRPLKMFTGEVMMNGSMIPRFKKKQIQKN